MVACERMYDGGLVGGSSSVYDKQALFALPHCDPTGLKLSTAAGAVGAWSGNWWGGNLKGLWYDTNQVGTRYWTRGSPCARARGIIVVFIHFRAWNSVLGGVPCS